MRQGVTGIQINIIKERLAEIAEDLLSDINGRCIESEITIGVHHDGDKYILLKLKAEALDDEESNLDEEFNRDNLCIGYAHETT